MASTIVKVISKTIVVDRSTHSGRCAVFCYVNGKFDSVHPYMPEARALAVAQCIADGDDVRKMLAEFDAKTAAEKTGD